MQRNMGVADRSIRAIIGVALLSLLVLSESNARWFGLIGLAPLLTSVAGWCPLYAALGIKTCDTNR